MILLVRRRRSCCRIACSRRHARHRRRSHRRHPARRPVRRQRRRRISIFRGHYIVPGFIDVHVHGVEGIDTLDGGDAIADDRGAAAAVRRHRVLPDVASRARRPPLRRHARGASARRGRRRPPGGARVLPAHLESNFINPEYKGAQPLDVPAQSARWRAAASARGRSGASPAPTSSTRSPRARPDVGIVTLAPELDGGLDLIRELVSHGHHVSLGHSGATYEQAHGGDRRRRAAGDASLQPHAAARPSRARAGRRGARARGRRRRAHLRRRPRASRDGARRARREAAVADHGDHRRHGRVRPAARHRVDDRRPPDHRPRRRLPATTAPSPAAC